MGESYDVVPTHLAIKAMRDSGYRNAAYAIAELIDNAIQAGAKQVDLLCVELEEVVQKRKRGRIQQIGVLDNGSGMSPEVLRSALQFGNGTHLQDRKGIGRFGMGLPNSSMSQARRVDVWTWTASPEDAIFTYLDLGEILNGTRTEVPLPKKTPIPKRWRQLGTRLESSGTLVVWSNLDRCTWRSARAIIRNSEEIVGRMYRRFIDGGDVAIRMAAFRAGQEHKPFIDEPARANDPMYLMAGTSCPEPWADKPLFEPWGEEPTRAIKIQFRDESHTVYVKYSLAKKEARLGHNPGGRSYGKHAARNLGVSVVRCNRELELDPKWMPGYNPVARWVGIEVDFPATLDEVFGVTNNKQSATNLADLAGVDRKALHERHGFDSYQALKDAWREDEDPREPLLTIKEAIDGSINSMIGLLKAQTAGLKNERYKGKDTPEAKATQATTQRKKEGHAGSSDAQESASPEEKQQEIENALKDEGVAEDPGELAASTIDTGNKYIFAHSETASGAFFSVKPKGGSIIVTLNTAHPAYEHLVAVLEEEGDEENPDDLRVRLTRAQNGLKLLLLAWARYEDEEPDGDRKIQAQEAREDWGRVARQFLRES